jgi:menaquinone-dependent protoporphyrinogen oxidase
MTRILVLYGTTEGQTRKIAEVLAAEMRARGAHVDLVDAAAHSPIPIAYAAVVVAASVHAGGYQRSVRRWVKANAAALRSRPTAFVSVCLGVLQHDPKVARELQAIIDRFLADTSWQPDATKIVAGALPYTKYNWLTRWAMKRIVRKAGGDIDTSRDYEYTDWDDVRRFAGEVLTMVDGRTSAAEARQPSVASTGAKRLGAHP